MYPIIVVAIFIIAAVALVRYLRRQPATTRRSLLIKYIFYVLVVLTIALAATGRIHWLGAAITAMIPIASKLVIWGLRFLPFLQQWRRHKQDSNNKSHAKSATNYSVANYEEALALFGLTATADKKQIIKRHRELIQKNHPDRGGSDYLAAKINEAKEVLLKATKK
jgi:DnaJ homolog subfamily C member 19